MKGEIYQSDIEFALREIAGGQADEMIVAGLGKRGIESTHARRLVFDLRAGNPVAATMPPWPTEWRPPEPPVKPKSRSGHDKHKHRPKSTPTPIWIWVLALICLGLVVALVIRGARNPGDTDAPLPQEPGGRTNALPPPPAARARTPVNPPQDSSGVHLECRAGTVQMGGRELAGESVLPVFHELLGPAGRTNSAGADGRLIYGYDQFGILLYAGSSGRVENIVLDYEALGGLNGATKAFLGTISVEGRQLKTDTNPAQLAEMKALGVQAKPEAGILSGKYGPLSFTFAYLKDTNHLSLVQLDF